MTVRTTKPALNLRERLTALDRDAGLALALATQSDAEAGLDNTTVMTPLRVAQAIAARHTSLRAENGWARMPDGLLIQWGLANANGSSAFPVAFPGACLQAVASDNDDGTPTVMGVQVSATHITVSSSESPGVARYIAIGY